MCCALLSAARALAWRPRGCLCLLWRREEKQVPISHRAKKTFVTINNSWMKAIPYLLKNMSKPALLHCIQLTNISYAISSLHRIVEVVWDLRKIWVCIFLRSTPLLQVELNSKSDAGLLQASSENLHLLALRGQWTLFQLSARYGKIFSVQFGSLTFVVVSGYQMVREALVHQAEIFADRPNIPLLQEIFRGFGKYSFRDFATNISSTCNDNNQSERRLNSTLSNCANKSLCTEGKCWSGSNNLTGVYLNLSGV